MIIKREKGEKEREKERRREEEAYLPISCSNTTIKYRILVLSETRTCGTGFINFRRLPKLKEHVNECNKKTRSLKKQKRKALNHMYMEYSIQQQIRN